MNRLALYVDIPDAINDSSTAEELRCLIDEFIEGKLRSTSKYNLLCNAINGGDKELRKWCEANGVSPYTCGRANYYQKIDRSQVLPGTLEHRDGRQPVLLRGSIDCMIARHSKTGGYSANGLAEAIAQRYLRRIKYTCLDAAEHDDNMRRLSVALRIKWATSYHCSMPGVWIGKDLIRVWLHGRRVDITTEQLNYLRIMYKIIRKTEDVEERLSLLREYRQAAAEDRAAA